MKKKLLSSEHKIKTFNFGIKAINEEENIIEGIFSTSAVDRQDEVVVQEGWKLDGYIKNPVVLWSHDNYQFPLAQMVRIGFENGQLAGAMKFAVDEYEMAATAFKLMKGKYLRAFSVGFQNNIYEVDNDQEVVKLVENVLLEVSVVNVPANQEALAKMKTLDILKKEEKEIKKDEPTEEEKNKEAIELISKSNTEAIRAVIETLTGVLKARGADNQVVKVEHPEKSGGDKKIPVKLLNKAIRELLALKKSQ